MKTSIDREAEEGLQMDERSEKAVTRSYITTMTEKEVTNENRGI